MLLDVSPLVFHPKNPAVKMRHLNPETVILFLISPLPPLNPIRSAHDGMLMSGTAIGDVERDGGTGAGPKAPAREPQANSLLFSEYMDDLFPVENMDFFSG